MRESHAIEDCGGCLSKNVEGRRPLTYSPDEIADAHSSEECSSNSGRI